MATKQHKAAFINGKQQQFEISTTPTPNPNEHSVLIRVKAVGINPVDHVIQDYGILVESYPAVLGSDIAGEIIEVGSSVTRFKKGDRVLAAPTYVINKSIEAGGFQEVAIVLEDAVSKIPDDLPFVKATVIPLSVATSAAGLYNEAFLNLPLPSSSPNPTPTGKKLLIWGGASSVGSSAVQLAIASGLEVHVTASEKNFDYVKNLGKHGKIHVYDYKSPSVVGDLTDALEKDCVGAYDAISTRDTQLACATILAQLGGGKIAATLAPPTDEIPATVNSAQVHALSIFYGPNKRVSESVFGDFLPKALANGQFIAAPSEEIVGKGLEKIQEAINLHKKGVSAKKLVVEL